MKERCFRYMPLLCIVVCAVVFLAVFAVMGRAVGIPYFVGGGIFGWYVRKWMQTKKEVSRRDGKEGLKRKAASPAGQLLFCMGGEPCQQELNTYDKENEGRSPGNISERGACQWQGTAAEESVPCHAERSGCFAVG